MQEIEKLKQQLSNQKKMQSLIHQREECERERLAIQTTLDQDIVMMHRYLQYHPQKAATIQKKIEQKKRCLEGVEKEIHALETHLESFDEDSGENRDMQWDRLVGAISHPQKKEEYTLLKSIWLHHVSQSEEIGIVKKKVETVCAPLEEGARALRPAKKRTFLDYLFGRHPKVVAAHKIYTASQNAESILHFLNSLLSSQETASIRLLYEDLLTFLTGLIKESQKRWNNRLYNETFFTLYSESHRLITTLCEQEKYFMQAAAEAAESIESWLNTH